MSYYIFIENGKINGSGQCQILNAEVINYEVTEAQFNTFNENPDCYVLIDGVPTLDTSILKEKQQNELFMRYRQIATDYLNETANERLYDDIKSLKGFTTSTNEKWRAEAFAGIAFEDAVWAKCYEVLNAVQAEEMEIPSEEEFIAMLPKIDWNDSIEPSEVSDGATDE